MPSGILTRRRTVIVPAPPAAGGTPFVTDTYTDTTGTALTSHTGELGATWTYQTSTGTSFLITDANRVRRAAGDGTGNAIATASGIPASADYSVQSDFVMVDATAKQVGIVLRCTDANNHYLLQWNGFASQFRISKVVAGVSSGLTTGGANYTDAGFTAGVTRVVKLSISGSALTVTIDGVSRITGTDSSLTSVGSAGIWATSNATNTNGVHLDNLQSA